MEERYRRTLGRELQKRFTDHVIGTDERHLKRLMIEYIRYYHDDRTHLALGKGTPTSREEVKFPMQLAGTVSMPRL